MLYFFLRKKQSFLDQSTIVLQTDFIHVIFLPKEEAIFLGPIYDRLTYTDFFHVIFLPKEEAIFLGSIYHCFTNTDLGKIASSLGRNIT
jgi:hypothetical protein